MRELGDRAFAECWQLREIVFQENCELQKIGDFCFYESGLRCLVTPPSLEEIGKGAFEKCRCLTNAVLNEGLLKLGWSAFEGSALRAVQLPSTLKRVESGAFNQCNDLVTVTLSEGIESLGLICF